jgi:hypothetical protein
MRQEDPDSSDQKREKDSRFHLAASPGGLARIDKPDDDKVRASTKNIAPRSFLKITSDSLLREIPKGCGDCITTIICGQDDLAVLEVRLS